jgi:phospholipid/cholesterol/gamma-HCH transport system substrate-binding protein
METKANYVVIGLFTLAVVVAIFGFVYWFQSIGSGAERAYYRVVFDGSVSGLRTGGSVLFNGIRVGEVTDLKLHAENPQQVVAWISIDKTTPVRRDTTVGLEFQGLTGIASLSMKGGTLAAAPLEGPKDNPPTLTADPAATQDVTQAARDMLKRLDLFVTENEKAFKSAVEHIEKFSAALARNAERVDKIAEGLQTLTAGQDGKSGELSEAAEAVKRMSETGTRTLNTIDRAVKNFDRNPSRLIWGGGPTMDESRKQQQQRRLQQNQPAN